VSWHEFLHYKGWTPAQAGELPDDFLHTEWQIYRIKSKWEML
jgi:hypothetical protein